MSNTSVASKNCQLRGGRHTMKATGIVRRIDELGRVVIPKEIRRTLRIRQGVPLEIYTGEDGEIILKKYSPMGDLFEYVQEYAAGLAQISGGTVLIGDRDMVMATGGIGGKRFLEHSLLEDVESVMNSRRTVTRDAAKESLYKVTDEDESTFQIQIFAPVLSDSDVVGIVAILSENREMLSEGNIKLAQAVALFLGKHMAD